MVSILAYYGVLLYFARCYNVMARFLYIYCQNNKNNIYNYAKR